MNQFSSPRDSPCTDQPNSQEVFTQTSAAQLRSIAALSVGLFIVASGVVKIVATTKAA